MSTLNGRLTGYSWSSSSQTFNINMSSAVCTLLIVATRQGTSPALYIAGQCSNTISIAKISDELGMLDITSSGTTLTIVTNAAYVVVSAFRIR